MAPSIFAGNRWKNVGGEIRVIRKESVENIGVFETSLFHEITPLQRGYPLTQCHLSSTRLPLFHEATPLPRCYSSSTRLLSSARLLSSIKLPLFHEVTHRPRGYSSKMRVSRPMGFNMNPNGQNRPWRVQQTWFHETDFLKIRNSHNSSKISISGPTGFNMNPKGQNRPWRVQQTWFHEINFFENQKQP